MTIGFVFWMLMIIWFVFGLYSNRTNFRGWVGAGHPLLFILLFLLGWKTFGFIIQG